MDAPRDPILSSTAAISPGGNAFTQATIENVGAGVAFNEYGLPAVDIVDLDLTRPISETELNRKIDVVFRKDVTDRMKRQIDIESYEPPLRDIAPKGSANLGAPLIGKTVTPTQMMGIALGHSFIVFMGMVRYSSFEESHQTEFCWFGTNPQPDQGTTPGKMNWVLCKDHNTIR